MNRTRRWCASAVVIALTGASGLTWVNPAPAAVRGEEPISRVVELRGTLEERIPGWPYRSPHWALLPQREGANVIVDISAVRLQLAQAVGRRVSLSGVYVARLMPETDRKARVLVVSKLKVE